MTRESPSSTDETAQNQAPLAVLMPAYNESEGIELAVAEVCAEVLDCVPGSYLIVVDDGSKDQTGPILDRLAAKDSRVRVIHKPNSGHGPSLIRALNEADSQYVFMIDSDMQIPLDCFPLLWKTANEPGVDGVFGMRADRQDPKARLFLSTLIKVVLGTMFDVKLFDTNAPCKIFRRKIWTELYARIQEPSLLTPSIAIAIYALKHQFKIVNISVRHRARTRGETSLRLGPLARFCWKGFKQLVKLRQKIS